jgi:hypothetical protein
VYCAGKGGLNGASKFTEHVKPAHRDARRAARGVDDLDLVMRTVFPTKELRDEAVEKYHAIEGGQQTLSNLAAYVTEIVRKGAEG